MANPVPAGADLATETLALVRAFLRAHRGDPWPANDEWLHIIERIPGLDRERTDLHRPDPPDEATFQDGSRLVKRGGVWQLGAPPR